jgi:hypothetical protein
LITKFEEFSDDQLKAVCILPNVEEEFSTKLQSDPYASHDKLNIKFATAEEHSIKFWKLDDSNISVYKKVNIKQSIITAVSSESLGFLFVLSKNGKILALDSQGEYVSSINRPGVDFTSISCSYENLFVGTASGTLHNYKISSLIAPKNSNLS